LIYSPQNIANSIDLDQIMKISSEYESIRTLTEHLQELLLLRHFQRKLLLDIPEKLLGLKIRWRFGMKAFSEIRKMYGNEMLGLRSGDEILILEGQFKGLTGKVISISYEKKLILVEILSSPSEQVSLALDSVSLLPVNTLNL
jgi:transcription antitermination factor NusG